MSDMPFFRDLFSQPLFYLSETLLMELRVVPLDRELKEEEFNIWCLGTRFFVLLWLDFL